MSWSDRQRYQGRSLNRGTNEIMKAANVMLRSPYFGGEKSDVTLVQGSYSGGVSASAGTHNGGGAIDVTAFNWKNREKVYRLLGVAFWHRPALPGVWSAHCHGIVCGDGTASSGAKSQVVSYYRRRNGLANNGKDAGYQMLVFPLFVSPEKSTGKGGVFYLKKASTAYTQPTSRSKSRGKVPVNGKFTVVAVVSVNKVRWGINVNGMCLPMSVLSRTKPVIKKPTPPKAKPVNPKPNPTVPAQPTSRLSMNVGTCNVIRWRLGKTNPRGVADFKKGKDYDERVKGIAALRKAASISLLATQEAGQYKDADLLDKAMGDADWSNRLHGDNAGDLTQALHWHKKRVELKGGKFTTEGSHHNTATWSLLRDVNSNIAGMFVTTHTEYRERGTKAPSQWDKVRESQTKTLIKKSEAIRDELQEEFKIKKIPIIYLGDFNSDKDDAYDGPGRAMSAAGYKDFETLSKKQTNSKWATYNKMEEKPFEGRRLDRGFADPDDVTVDDLRTLWGYPFTDHNMIGADIQFANA